MQKSLALVSGLLLLGSAFQFAKAQEKASRTLKVKVNYTGSGTVDEKHKIQVFIFDSPDFATGNGMPTGMQMTEAKDGTVTFTDIAGSPVYVATVYDPTGGYDGQSGPPPSGASLGMYSKEPPKPGPVDIEAGKTVEIEVAFDDSAKMP
ncbi:MAG TPA: hypothetical protein VMT86_20730 [Bryobacteraceae bacterium]|nr:hypothetical protein [Bryobacteraceae bacterium]